MRLRSPRAGGAAFAVAWLVAACGSAGGGSRGPAGPTAPSVTVLTLNIWHDQQDWPSRLGAILDGIRAADPDVIALQEVLQHDSLANQAQTIADALGYDVYFSSVDPPSSVKRYGNAILTRHTVLASGWHALEPTNDYRTVAHVRIDVRGRAVDLYDTHLHHTAEGSEIRRLQVLDLLDFVERTRGAGPLILMGDFNARADAPELAPLRTRFRDALALLQPALAETVTTLNPAKGHTPRRIDHVFFGDGSAHGLRPQRADVVLDEPAVTGVWPSDHFGVIVRFALAKAKVSGAVRTRMPGTAAGSGVGG